MYIFSRSIRLAPGDYRQQMAWAMAITDKVNQISEVPVLLWNPFASPQAGVLAWSLAVPNLALLEATDDKLAADDGYLGQVAEGARHVSDGSLTDSLVELIIADPDVDPARIRYASAGSATAQPGKVSRASEVGVEIARQLKSATGRPTQFGAMVTGPYGTFQWSTLFESIEQLEEAQQNMRTNRDLIRLFEGDAVEVFGPTGDQTIVRRLM